VETSVWNVDNLDWPGLRGERKISTVGPHLSRKTPPANPAQQHQTITSGFAAQIALPLKVGRTRLPIVAGLVVIYNDLRGHAGKYAGN